jgi:transposase InsO family protein
VIAAFVDEMRTEGHAVESICRVLREQGCQIAALTYRLWVQPDRVFTYVRTWTGRVYVAFILDVFVQKIVAWNAATSKDVELVTVPLRMATWQRAREDSPSCQVT